MEGESGGTRSIIDEIHSKDIQGDQMEGEIGVTRSVIDELHCWEIVIFKVKVVLPEVSLTNFILPISKEIKWKLKVVLFKVKLIPFIVGYPRSSNGR